MKTNSRFSKWLLPAVGLIAVALCPAFLSGDKSGRFIAHEWGTFTSVQGGDGVLLAWRPLESSRLPRFVHDWKNPGLNRQPAGFLAFGKGGITALQRMETPVIYFYSDEEQTVDVTVKFPQGAITEWYPQISEIGPSAVPVPALVSTMDGYAHKMGAKPAFTLAALLKDRNVAESLARWTQVKLSPAGQNLGLASALARDFSGSHYFSARDTDADYLQVSSTAATNPLPEREKFLFYRGVGNFATPLRVTVEADESVTIANTGPEPLAHLMLLGLEKGAGDFVPIDLLSPGEKRAIPARLTKHSIPLERLSRQVGAEMAKALVKEGLYEREAAAMVNTWKDSWFEQDGLRVLYVLPRAWTDRTLPLTLNPAPRDLVRVMVGRAEVLTSALQQRLSALLAKAARGDEPAREEVVTEFRSLGRFAEPTLQLVTNGARDDIHRTAWDLFQTAARAAGMDKPL